MVAVKNKAIGEAAKTIYSLSEDERIRQQCEAREDYLKQKHDSERRTRNLLRTLDEKDKELAEKDKALADQAKALEKKDSVLADQAEALERNAKEIAALKAMLAAK